MSATRQQLEIDQLSQQKSSLALAVAQGDETARKEFSKVCKRIAELQIEAEIEDLAAKEQARLEAEAEAARLTEVRQEKETRLANLRQAKTAAFERLRRQAKQLVPAITEARKAAVEVYQLSEEIRLDTHPNSNGPATKWNAPE